MGQQKSRRQFLKNAVKSLGLLGIGPALSQVILQSMASHANATTNLQNYLYVFFAMPGGPPRWFFDLPLTPNGLKKDFFDTKTGLGTFVGVEMNKPTVIYKPWLDPTSGFYLPPVWGSNPSGGAFTNCLSNACFIRGLDLEINNHELGRMRNQSPNIGGISIGGMVSEKASTPFPAVTFGSISQAFKAEKPMASIALNLTVNSTTNPISTSLKYFKQTIYENSLVKDHVQKRFDEYANKNQFKQSGLVQSAERAEELLRQNISRFTDQWKPVYEKYQIKIKEAMSRTNTSLFMEQAPIPSPVPINNKPDSRIRYADGLFVEGHTDLRDLISDQATIANLAATFASTEIMLGMGLTQVLTADLSGISGIKVKPTGTMVSISSDQHFVGSIVSTIVTTFYYRAILSCTEELVIMLKEKGLFERTIIQFGAEFNRNAKTDSSGSDHGFKGGSALIISGMMEKTAVIGNIKDDPDTNHRGTWGLAANHPVTDNHYPIRINDLARTICAMLEIKNVTNNGEYLLQKKGNFWGPYPGAKGEAKNVKAS